MKKAKLGDVYLLQEKDLHIYLQYVDYNDVMSHLVRVFDESYKKLDEESLNSLIKTEERFSIFFPLQHAINKKIVEYVNTYEIPKKYSIPTIMRTPYKINGLRQWRLIEVSTRKILEKKYELSCEDLKYSPWGTANDAYIIDRIKENFKLIEWK